MAQAGADGGLIVTPDAAADVRLVAVGAVPEGAVILGHLIAIPTAQPRQLVAVRTEAAPTSAGPGLVIDPWGRRVMLHGKELELTRREFELLQHLVTHRGRVFTREELLASVWDLPDPRYAPPRTVDVHVARLRRKLGPTAGALQTLRGVGYRWSARPDRDSPS